MSVTSCRMMKIQEQNPHHFTFGITEKPHDVIWRVVKEVMLQSAVGGKHSLFYWWLLRLNFSTFLTFSKRKKKLENKAFSIFYFSYLIDHLIEDFTFLHFWIYENTFIFTYMHINIHISSENWCFRATTNTRGQISLQWCKHDYYTSRARFC